MLPSNKVNFEPCDAQGLIQKKKISDLAIGIDMKLKVSLYLQVLPAATTGEIFHNQPVICASGWAEPFPSSTTIPTTFRVTRARCTPFRTGKTQQSLHSGL